MTHEDVSRDQFAVIRIEGMHSHKCEQALRRALSGHVGVYEVEIDFASGQASVLFNKRAVTVEKLMASVEDAGYAATGYVLGQTNN